MAWTDLSSKKNRNKHESMVTPLNFNMVTFSKPSFCCIFCEMSKRYFFFYGSYVQNEVSRIPPHFHIRESCRLSNPWICGRVFCRRNVEVLIADQCLRRIEYLYLGSNFHYPYTSSHTKRNCENHVFQISCYPRHPAIPP